MMYFLLLPIFLLIIYVMPVNMSISFKKNGRNDNITIGLRTLYGLLKLKSEIPFLYITFENGRPAIKYKLEVANRERSKILARFTRLFTLTEGEGLYKTYKKFKHRLIPVINYITRRARISTFSLKLKLGTGEAAATGILYGVVWIIIGNIMTFTRSHLDIREPRIVIIPVFSKVQTDMDFNCIISLKLGHIIIAGIRVIPVLLSINRKKNRNNII